MCARARGVLYSYGTLEQLERVDFGGPLHSLVLVRDSKMSASSSPACRVLDLVLCFAGGVRGVLLYAVDTFMQFRTFPDGWKHPPRIQNLYFWHVGMVATGVLWLANTLDCP